MTNNTLNRTDLRKLLVTAERQVRDMALPARLDIDIALDAILNGEVDINVSETDSDDPAVRLVNACILSDGRWWAEWQTTYCVTEDQLVDWVRDRAGRDCTDDEAARIVDGLSARGLIKLDENDSFLLRKMTDDEWHQESADILA